MCTPDREKQLSWSLQCAGDEVSRGLDRKGALSFSLSPHPRLSLRFIDLYLCLDVFAWLSQYVQGAEEGTGSPRSRIIDNCEVPSVGARN